eukprot:Gb_22501 [translate_table: standard]
MTALVCIDDSEHSDGDPMHFCCILDVSFAHAAWMDQQCVQILKSTVELELKSSSNSSKSWVTREGHNTSKAHKSNDYPAGIDSFLDRMSSCRVGESLTLSCRGYLQLIGVPIAVWKKLGEKSSYGSFVTISSLGMRSVPSELLNTQDFCRKLWIKMEMIQPSGMRRKRSNLRQLLIYCLAMLLSSKIVVLVLAVSGPSYIELSTNVVLTKEGVAPEPLKDTQILEEPMQENFIGIGRRYLSGPGSSPPRCTSKCAKCTPCKAVHVPVQPGTPRPAEYYPEAWRCKCRFTKLPCFCQPGPRAPHGY